MTYSFMSSISDRDDFKSPHYAMRGAGSAPVTGHDRFQHARPVNGDVDIPLSKEHALKRADPDLFHPSGFPIRWLPKRVTHLFL